MPVRAHVIAFATLGSVLLAASPTNAAQYLATITGTADTTSFSRNTLAYFGGGATGQSFEATILYSTDGAKQTGPHTYAGGPGLTANYGPHASPIQDVTITINGKSVSFTADTRSEAGYANPFLPYGTPGSFYFNALSDPGNANGGYQVEDFYGLALAGLFPWNADVTTTLPAGGYGTSSFSVALYGTDPGVRFGGYLNPQTFTVNDYVPSPPAGASPSNPLLPGNITPEGGFGFDYNATQGVPIYFDPLVAIGYDFLVEMGPNIASALFPALAGDTDGYSIYALSDPSTPLATDVLGDQWIDFTSLPGYANGISGFALRGINTTAGLSPSDYQAFVTGLTFVGSGPGHLTQTPIALDVSAVPEPTTWALMLLGFGGAGIILRRARTGNRGWISCGSRQSLGG